MRTSSTTRKRKRKEPSRTGGKQRRSGMDQPARCVEIVGVPLDHGAGRRGVGLGPEAIRLAGLHRSLAKLGLSVRDRGNLAIAIPEIADIGARDARYLGVVAATCADLARHVREILNAGAIPLVIGGDHSIAIGTVSGLADYFRDQTDHPSAATSAAKEDRSDPTTDIGVLWFDAHADMNTPRTSPSGNIHGMACASLLGRGPEQLTAIAYRGAKISPRQLVQIGLRDLDPAEQKRLSRLGIRAFTMSDIDKKGMAAVISEALEVLHRETKILHISFDVDVMDPQIAPGTGTPKRGGLTYREAHLSLEMIAETGKLGSLEVVEVNPILDRQNTTAELAVEVIASALGQKIF